MKNKFMKATVATSAMLLTLILAGCSGTDTADQPDTGSETEEPTTSISVDKAEYEPGADITVTYDIVEDLGDSAWIGIVPSDTAHGKETDGDAVDVSYQYLNGSMGGTKEFRAPGEAGEYDVRIYSDDGTNGVELGYASFEVLAVESDEATLSLEETTYAAGDEITVSFTAPADLDDRAWVGLIPSDVEHGSEATNDANDLDYEYVNGQTEGTMTFTAPSEAGSYDFRMNSSDSNGEEVASITFTVE